MESKGKAMKTSRVVLCFFLALLLLSGQCSAGFRGCIRACFHECREKGGNGYSCAMKCFNSCLPGGRGRHPPCADACANQCSDPDVEKMGECLGSCSETKC